MKLGIACHAVCLAKIHKATICHLLNLVDKCWLILGILTMIKHLSLHFNRKCERASRLSKQIRDGPSLHCENVRESSMTAL